MIFCLAIGAIINFNEGSVKLEETTFSTDIKQNRMVAEKTDNRVRTMTNVILRPHTT